jgi:hypothetical protein
MYYQISRNIPIFFSTREPKHKKNSNTQNDEDGESKSDSKRGGSTSYEGGMGGRADGGEWQVELPTPVDPREGRQRGSYQGSNVMVSTSGTSSVYRVNSGSNLPQSIGVTEGHEYSPDEYPALMTTAPPPSNNDNNSKLKWVPKSNESVSNISSATVYDGMSSGSLGNIKIVSKKQKKQKNQDTTSNNTTTTASYKDAIEPPASLAVRINM